MASPLLAMNSTVLCSHGGQAKATAPASRVLLGGAPAVLAPPPWTVAGCPFPPNSGGPCVTAMWSTFTMRVTSMSQPLVLSSGSATCAPTGVPLMPVAFQVRVMAT
ncbi:hypothetical protein [Propioniciclava sinopodophylli]|uniref:hypothetical protein n=1 Tax=Propioniciclava sinopodophylli TaxID=1837344 RepID=UPI002490E7A4|nr:hypothetical protein [Propioniciclava sinopodophylli]